MEQKTSAYKRIKYAIAESLRKNQWPKGKAIASETALSRRYGVSIGTVRKAVDELVKENVLVREHGRGTFVCSQTSDYMLDVFYRLEGYDGSRELPKSRLLSFEKTLPTQEIASRLNLRTDEPIFSIHKVMTKNDIPAIYDEIAVPAKFFAYITEQTLVQYQSTLYEIFQKEYGLTVVQVKETIEACIPPEHVRNYLNMAVGEPALFIKRQGLLSREIPIETRYRYVASKVLRYFNSLDGW
jgi:GntR family transcriptional regulator